MSWQHLILMRDSQCGYIGTHAVYLCRGTAALRGAHCAHGQSPLRPWDTRKYDVQHKVSSEIAILVAKVIGQLHAVVILGVSRWYNLMYIHAHHVLLTTLFVLVFTVEQTADSAIISFLP